MSMTTGIVLADDAALTRAAIAAFLAGYCGGSRRSYATGLRIFAAWCTEANLELSASAGRISSCSAGGWRRRAKCAPPSPAGCPRWPASTATASRRASSGATRPPTSAAPKSTTNPARSASTATSWAPSSSQAGLGSARDHALAALLAVNGLRISEALGADIDDLEFERGHRTVKVVGEGGKHAVIPLAPRTSRAPDLYIGERTIGPIFLGAKGGCMDR